MKKILICGLVLLSLFIIYLANMDRKVYYLALGSSNKYVSGNLRNYSFYVDNYLLEKGVLEKSVFDYSSDDDRITDIFNKINNNVKGKDSTLKNALVKADLVTLTISIKDILSKINDSSILYSEIYDYIDDLTFDLEKLFKLMREYCKEDIVFVGYYNNYSNDEVKDIFDYMNKRYKEVCEDYDIKYVDLNNVNLSKDVLTSEDYKVIGDKVVSVISKNIFEG